MSKFYRVWSGSIDGYVFTESAFETLQGQLNGVESKVISSVEIEPNERIYDVVDLTDLGYKASTDGNVEEEVELTQQSDDHFDEWDETNPDFEIDDGTDWGA